MQGWYRDDVHLDDKLRTSHCILLVIVAVAVDLLSFARAVLSIFALSMSYHYD